MTLSRIISDVDEHSEEGVIFAKKIDGRFLPSSEAVVVMLNDEETDLPTNQIAEMHCPGFEYFLEVFLVKDMLENLKHMVGYKSLQQKIDRIIQYAESDA